MVVLIESANEDENGKLSCSICGASGYRNMIRHLKGVHGLTPSQYLEQFPDDKVYTDDMIQKFSKGGYAANQAMQDAGLDFSERSRKARKTEVENDPDAYLKRNRKLYQDPGFKDRATKRVMNLNRWHGDRYRYNDMSLRSTWEVKFAQWLNEVGVKYNYEGVKVKYFDPVRQEIRTYFPDFYLPDYNLCIEVKPKCDLESPVVLAKRSACLEAGYKFIFITQDELKNLSVELLNV